MRVVCGAVSLFLIVAAIGAMQLNLQQIRAGNGIPADPAQRTVYTCGLFVVPTMALAAGMGCGYLAFRRKTRSRRPELPLLFEPPPVLPDETPLVVSEPPLAPGVWSFDVTDREEITCRCREGEFCMFLAMGRPTAYLPCKEKWQRISPNWATNRWDEVHAQFQDWCENESLPLVVDDHQDIYEFREYSNSQGTDRVSPDAQSTV
jgi:hypothetical protein